MATLASVEIRDVFASRPTAGIAGRRFISTDTGVEYYDDGSAWHAITTDAGQITSGTLPAARLPNPSSSTLGGVESIASASHQFLTSISTSGVPSAAQPTEADLSLSDITTNNVSITKHGLAPKAPNDATKYLDGTGAYSVPTASSGTVTSVALTVPGWLSVSGSPVTTTGTLAVSATTGQTANQFLATPNGSSGTVGLRTIAAADLPLATTGAFGVVKPDGTTITISSGVITSTSSGGMTNPMTTSGDIIYGGSSGTPTRLAGGTSGYVLTSNGTTSAPSWQAATGGGGGSPSLPDVASFTWVNQGSTTAVQTVANGPIMMKIPDTSSLNWRGLFVAQPSTPYKLIAQIRMVIPGFANTQDAGVYFYDGTKLMGFEFLATSSGVVPRVEKITNVTTDGSTAVTGYGSFGSATTNIVSPIYSPLWVQLRNSGTTIYFDFSFDGSNFINLYSESVGTFITPTHIGFGGVSVVSNANYYVINNLLAWSTPANATL